MATGQEFGRFMAAQAETRTARAEYNNASRGLELALIRERCAEVISQHQPIAASGLDREKVAQLLAYVMHGRKMPVEQREGQ